MYQLTTFAQVCMYLIHLYTKLVAMSESYHSWTVTPTPLLNTPKQKSVGPNFRMEPEIDSLPPTKRLTSYSFPACNSRLY